MVGASVGGFASAPTVGATPDACSQSSTVFGALVTAPTDSYTIYVKLGSVGQLADIQVSVAEDGICTVTGGGTASGDEWRAMGSVEAFVDESEIQVNIASDQLESTYEYDRPSVLLLSDTNPACVPSTECYVEINGEQAALQPSSTGLDTGTLRAFLLEAVDPETITEVRYYVDGEYMYKTDSLETFNEQFIPYYGRTTSRVILFENGQTAVIEKNIPGVHADSPSAMITRSIHKYEPFLIWIGVMAGVIIIFQIVRHILHAIGDRRYWRYAHGLDHEETTSGPITPARWSHIFFIEKVKHVVSGLGIVALVGAISIVIILVLDSYVVRLAHVSGPSMETTLEDGDRIFIDKTGVTFARINQAHFVPERGQIIAAYLLSRYQDESEISDEDLMIKRVIGLPGERITIDGNVVTIYNAQHPDGFSPSEGTEWESALISETSQRRLDLKLSNNELFVIGDNRPASIDSRANGPVSLEDVIGVVR